MKTRILHIFTRTPLHVGAGSSVGAIDMPIQRERHTQIPIIPGSSLKGVLRDRWNDKKEEQVEIFGSAPGATELKIGNLTVGEARTLCFPVRSAKGAFAWITSPLAIARYARDTGQESPSFDSPGDESCYAGDAVKLAEQVILEEYKFSGDKPLPAGVTNLLVNAFQNDTIWKTLADRLVIVSDGIFSHFCATACEVQQRIQIDDETGTAKGTALFNQENLPSETMLYAVLTQRKEDKKGLPELEADILANPVQQIGGDETIGLGYCSLALSGGAQ